METVNENPAPPTAAQKWRERLYALIAIFLLLTFAACSGLITALELPLRLVLGWIWHLVQAAPVLLPQWPKLLVPLGCLALATWLVHRFVRWWLAAKGSAVGWHGRHTLSATALVLLGAAAAIGLSGVVHQIVWLSNEPLHERRGADFARADAMNSANQILLALEDFHLEQGCFPDSLADLSLPSQLTMVRPHHGGAPEPFVYLKPTTAPDPDTVVLVSPILRQSDVVILGYLPRTTDAYPSTGLPEILETRRMPAARTHE